MNTSDEEEVCPGCGVKLNNTPIYYIIGLHLYVCEDCRPKFMEKIKEYYPLSPKKE